MSPESLPFRIATWLIPLVVAIVLHEIAHGWTALAFGDPTAKRKRRLSLNPMRHVDPVGTVVLPLALAVSGMPVFGWAKPVPSRSNQPGVEIAAKMSMIIASAAISGSTPRDQRMTM